MNYCEHCPHCETAKGVRAEKARRDARVVAVRKLAWRERKLWCCALALIARGEPRKALGKRIGVTATTITRWLRRHESGRPLACAGACKAALRLEAA